MPINQTAELVALLKQHGTNTSETLKHAIGLSPRGEPLANKRFNSIVTKSRKAGYIQETGVAQGNIKTWELTEAGAKLIEGYTPNPIAFLSELMHKPQRDYPRAREAPAPEPQIKFSAASSQLVDLVSAIAHQTDICITALENERARHVQAIAELDSAIDTIKNQEE